MQTDITFYQCGTSPVTGIGLGISPESLNDSLAGPIAALLFDDDGTKGIVNLLEGVADTEFSQDSLAALLTNDNTPEDWRVGEALAEYYLTENRTCFFPWPDGRDERRRGASLPGADLVGLQNEDGQERFAFAEVKTSSAQTYPPGVMHGRHGLKQQLEDLRDNCDVRNDLVLYLGYRASGASWSDRFRSACRAYLCDTCDVRIFGLLVRDVAPHEDDLRTRVTRLANGCPPTTRIELTALYLPSGSVCSLSATVMASRRRHGGE